MSETTDDISQYRVKGHRFCIISFNVEHAARILDILESWEVELLLVGTEYVYKQVKALLPKLKGFVRFRLLTSIKCIALERDIVAFQPHYLLTYGCYEKVSDPMIASAQHLAVNFHPSLLPSYKGAAPHSLPIQNQDVFAGLSVHKLTSEFDCGDIVLQLRVAVAPTMTESLLNAEYSRLMLDAFIQFLLRLEKGKLEVQPNPKGYPLAPAKRNKDFWFDPELSAEELERFVRARNQKDSLSIVLVTGRKHFSIQEVSVCDSIDDIPEAQNVTVGDLIFIRDKSLLCCGQGYLWITVVFQHHRSTMSIERYRQYEDLQVGDQLQLKYPGTLPHLAAIADEKALWYSEIVNRYFK